jgi:hypothetical protein
MDFVMLKYIYDAKNKNIEKFDSPGMTPSMAPSFMSIIPPVSEGDVAKGGATASSSSVVFLIIALLAAYLSWNYTKEHNIETGMAVIYTLAAFNCGSCFLSFYLCFANKSN